MCGAPIRRERTRWYSAPRFTDTPICGETHELGECRFGLGHAGLLSQWVATKTLELIDENMGTGKVALAEIRALRLTFGIIPNRLSVSLQATGLTSAPSPRHGSQTESQIPDFDHLNPHLNRKVPISARPQEPRHPSETATGGEPPRRRTEPQVVRVQHQP